MQQDDDVWSSFWLTRKPKDELTFLFRNIIRDKIPMKGNILMFWQSLMEYYLNDTTNGVPTNGKDRSSARGNMNKALRSGTMSWKIFKIGLKFLKARSVRFQVIIDWGPDKEATVHHITTAILSDDSLGVSSMAKKFIIPTANTEFNKIPILQDIVEELPKDPIT